MGIVPREKHQVGVRLDAFRRRAGKSFRPFRAHAELKSGFQTNDSSYEIFYVMLLLDDGGVELFDLIGQFNRVAKASHTRSVHPMLILSEKQP